MPQRKGISSQVHQPSRQDPVLCSISYVMTSSPSACPGLGFWPKTQSKECSRSQCGWLLVHGDSSGKPEGHRYCLVASLMPHFPPPSFSPSLPSSLFSFLPFLSIPPFFLFPFHNLSPPPSSFFSPFSSVFGPWFPTFSFL